MADPKLKANWELVNQAQADLVTSSLPPNPTLSADGIFLPFRRPTPERPGGPPQYDIQAGYPIDWFLFGKRAAAIRSSQIGIDVTAADYADLVRQRILGTITSYYDVLEAKALLEVAKENYSNQPERAIDREFVLETIVTRMPYENYERTFNTFLRWARYGELFAYDEAAQRISLVQKGD